MHMVGAESVHDPVGLDRETYRHTAREIEGHLAHLVDELVGPEARRDG